MGKYLGKCNFLFTGTDSDSQSNLVKCPMLNIHQFHKKLMNMNKCPKILALINLIIRLSI